MPSLTFDHVAKRFGAASIVDDFSLAVADRELLVLVGGSGSGKSTLLRLVAGLESVTAGRIRIDDEDITDLPSRARDVAMVFQDYALYPHLSVRDNLALGLKLRKLPKPEIARRIAWAGGMLGLDPLLDRKPKQLSGGQRQRVAMGRAMVREPRVFLFDEPLSNLDAGLRGQMRIEIGALQRRLGTTTVYVTHDQVEAMTLGDRIVVLADGRIQQVGPPIELYARPTNRFVAGFIGTPPMNFIDGRLDAGDGAALFVAEGVRLALPPGRRAPGAGPAAVSLGIRPEHLSVVGEPGPDGPGPDAPGARLSGRVLLVERLGGTSHVHFDVGPYRLLAAVTGDRLPAPGDAITVTVPPERVHLFGADGRTITG